MLAVSIPDHQVYDINESIRDMVVAYLINQIKQNSHENKGL